MTIEKNIEKNDSEKWRIDCERFVGFVDIMGFKDLVMRKSHEEVGELLDKLFEAKDVVPIFSKTTKRILTVGKDPFKLKKIEAVSFSDTIVFFTEDNSEASWNSISLALQLLLIKAFQVGLPIKGSVALGRMNADLDKGIFYGQPLIDAYLLQEEVKYYGIVVDASVHGFLQKTFITEKKKVAALYWLKTPLKGGSVFHYNIISATNTEIITKLYDTVSGITRCYVDNTIDMINMCSKQ